MEDEKTIVSALEWTDWIVIGLTLLASAAIGIYYRFTGGRQKTEAEYFSADKSVGVVMLSFTMMISYLSAIALLGSSAENYSYGAQFNIFYSGLFLGTPVVSYFYLPVFYQLGTMSIFEYLERRFGVTTRLVASIINYFQITLYTGVVIYAPALAVQATTGLSEFTSILMIGLICTFYSSIGGIKAVIITDVLQGALMFICVYSVIGVAVSDLDGGLLSVIDIAHKGGRLNFFNFDFDPTVRHTWWTLTIGGYFFFLSVFACSQVQMQRMLTARTLADARKALWLNVPMTLTLVTTISFSGLVLYAYYELCDPVASGKIKSYDMVMPYFAKDRMTRIPALTGLFIAGVFSASLSTVSAMLNSLAAVALSDYIKPLYRKFGKEFPDDRAAFYGKILGIIMGLVSLCIAFLASKMGALIQAVMGIHGATGGPILGLFTMGMFMETVEQIGAVIGTVVALIFTFFTIFAPRPLTPHLPMRIDGCDNSTSIFTDITETDDPTSYFYLSRLSYLWVAPFGFNIAVTVGFVVSFIVRKCFQIRPFTPDPNLFTPLIAARIKRRCEKEAKNSQVFVLDTKNFNHTE